MKDLPEALWHRTFQTRAFRRVMDGTPSERRGGAPTGLRRLYADQPCKAITSGAISEFVHYSEDRFLTIRECARIQTFPDSFKFSGTTSERILQIGNAVPPLLAEAIANSLHADLVSKLSNANTPGRLLSFVPTVSDGCSPVLEQVIARVQKLVTCLNPS
jgi:DNA (cytosine-5)-methyltransferase 1